MSGDACEAGAGIQEMTCGIIEHFPTGFPLKARGNDEQKRINRIKRKNLSIPPIIVESRHPRVIVAEMTAFIKKIP
jgi:hypothetical protein